MFWKRLNRILIGSIIICFTAWAGMQIYAAAKHRRVMAAWEREFGPLKDIPTKYPPIEMNQCAIDLQSLCLNLGFSIWDRSENQKGATADLAAKEFDSIRNPLREYLKAQTYKEKGEIERSPKEVLTFLHAHRSELKAIISLLLSSESPQWAFSLKPRADREIRITRAFAGKGESLLLPSDPLGFRLLDYLGFQYLVVTHALNMHLEGENAKAEDAFEASHRLDRSVASRPMADDLLIAIASWKLKIVLARRLPVGMIKVDDLVVPSNLREKSREAIVVYGWIFDESYIQIIKEAKSTLAEKVNYSIGGFVVSLMHDNYLDRLNHIASAISKEDICTFQRPEIEFAWHENRNPFMFGALLWTPIWLNLVERAHEVELALEFTRLIQRYKAMPEWPSTPVEESVRSCASAKWKITPQADGSLFLSIDQEPPWYTARPADQPKLPLHYALAPRQK